MWRLLKLRKRQAAILFKSNTTGSDSGSGNERGSGSSGGSTSGCDVRSVLVAGPPVLGMVAHTLALRDVTLPLASV